MTLEERIERVNHMTELYDHIHDAIYIEIAVDGEDYSEYWMVDDAAEIITSLKSELDELVEYYQSPAWIEDFDAERQGMFPLEMDRGILTEDTIYDLLTDIDSFSKKCNVYYSADRIDLEAVRTTAEDYYRKGFFCCEAVVATIREMFQVDVSESVIAMSSGMSVGVGRSGCLCGSVNGGVMVLGMFFGRTEPLGPKDEGVNHLMQLTGELHSWFKENNGKNSTCCRALTREFDMASGEHREQCIKFTGMCAWKTAEILCRELDIETV